MFPKDLIERLEFMVQYKYTKESFTTFQEGIKREWVMTNGLGSYAGSSLIGAHSRTHQGYLIASLHAPIERYLVFSKVNEKFCTTDAEYDFEVRNYENNLFSAIRMLCIIRSRQEELFLK